MGGGVKVTKSQRKQLDEISALRRAAAARGDWAEVARLEEDWRFVFRQTYR